MLSRLSSAVRSSVFRNVGGLALASQPQVARHFVLAQAMHFNTSTTMMHTHSRTPVVKMNLDLAQRHQTERKPTATEICQGANTERSREICKEIADKLSGDGYMYCSAKVQAKLAAFFVQGNEKMKANYDGSFEKYAEGMLRGLELALTFNSNKAQTVVTLQKAFDDGLSYGNNGVKLWAFGNLTGRVAHLYGLTDEGFFSFEQVQKLLEGYNRFGVNCKDVNNEFLVLTQKVTRGLIQANTMAPVDALRYARQLDEDRHVQNPLSTIYKEVSESNYRRSISFGAGA